MSGAQDSDLVNELIAVCHDGEGFYRHAAKAVENSELRSLFWEMADSRRQIAEALSDKVVGRLGEGRDSAALSLRMRRLYAEVEARLARDSDVTYVSELERSEANTLDNFRQSIGSVQSTRLAQELARHLASIQVMHDRMHLIREEIEGRQRR
ncbi:PA2169 family four-helix-bundle protein [Marinobacterium lutimaris]|uniref:DUF2383 domain-containing protein n=1 Tax=Marinobacterium lutimaris TaxID=568106 RepID=A0A1H5UCM7_9GAMM|nr:PA2169 family four-helix-bundle protein [Marinobacterium lutimaris]SEF72862.1 conserved hypothetical protein [Marinobacterium lutimaris]